MGRTKEKVNNILEPRPLHALLSIQINSQAHLLSVPASQTQLIHPGSPQHLRTHTRLGLTLT